MRSALTVSCTLTALLWAGTVAALPILPGATCTGTCGTLAAADGVVTLPPLGGSYAYVSTVGAPTLGTAGLQLAGTTNGSILVMPAFTAVAGTVLEFWFDYVTTDGGAYADYAWADLLNAGDLSRAAMIFTAETNASGNTVPGQTLPALSATLSPTSTGVVPGAPAFSVLGTDSATCYAAGCGYTGWIKATYRVGVSGTYRLRTGVANVSDTSFASALASAASVRVPEPGSLLTFATAVAATVLRRRRRRPAGPHQAD